MIAADPHVRALNPVHYKTVRVNNLDIFYREAGPPGGARDPAAARFPNFF